MRQRRLDTLEQWDGFVGERYNPNKKTEEFRNYEDTAPGVLEKKREYTGLKRSKMGVWDALDYLNTLVDDSDPDTDLSQIDHNLQAADAIRRDGHRDWFQLTGLLHDIGKMLCLYDEPQWGVVGDTFPTGCAYSDKTVFHQFFKDNPEQAADWTRST